MAIEIRIPRLGWSMEEGRFLGWQKNDGDPIRMGDVLYELEGEKAIQEVESVDEGILRISPDCPPADTLLKVGALLGYIASADEPCPWESIRAEDSKPLQPESARADVAARSAESPAPGSAPNRPIAAGPAVRRMARELGVSLDAIVGSGPGGKVYPPDLHRATGTKRAAISVIASPRARRTAGQLGIDWTSIQGTGRNGRVREADVHQAATGAAARPLAAARTPPGVRIPISSRRRTIARRMLAGVQQTAPVTITTRADASALSAFRKRCKSAWTIVPAYTDLIASLSARILQQHPLLAARWEDDAIYTPEADGFHVGIAVDTADGLLVPVIRDVPSMPLAELAKASRELIERARIGKVTASELEGGVFTITNLGAFGIDAFTPIINLPQTSILGLGAVRREPVFTEGDRIEARDLFTLSLTFDHRVIDGAAAARFLADIRQGIEDFSGDAA